MQNDTIPAQALPMTGTIDSRIGPLAFLAKLRGFGQFTGHMSLQ